MGIEDLNQPVTQPEIGELMRAIPAGGETAKLHSTARRMAFQLDALKREVKKYKEALTWIENFHPSGNHAGVCLVAKALAGNRP